MITRQFSEGQLVREKLQILPEFPKKSNRSPGVAPNPIPRNSYTFSQLSLVSSKLKALAPVPFHFANRIPKNFQPDILLRLNKFFVGVLIKFFLEVISLKLSEIFKSTAS